MTGRAIVVSHGQPTDPDPAEKVLGQFAAEVASHLDEWNVNSATLAKPGALDTALQAAGPNPVIYPMFMTHGWFTGDLLIKRLGNRQAKILPPLGVDPDLPRTIACHLNTVLENEGWQPGNTQLFLAAHGSGRSPNAARDTWAFARALSHHIQMAELRVGFVEEYPYLADAVAGLSDRAICLPFFAAKGGHVMDDIPFALEQSRFQGICLDPIGCSPAVTGLVANSIRHARAKA